MSGPFTIWSNNGFAPAQAAARELLNHGVTPHTLIAFETGADGSAGAAQAALLNADIIFGYPDAATVSNAAHLRWVHLNSAGYTSFDKPELLDLLRKRGIVLTNSSSVYDEPCAQHLLAMILAIARGLPRALDIQRNERSWPNLELRAQLHLLNKQRLLILGFGAIARRLVELLRPLNLEVTAVRRRVSGDESVNVADVAKVDKLLPLADHVVNILPANDGTIDFLNADRLELLKQGAVLYNIGRGSTLDQATLMRVLNQGKLRAAYLDVTDPEPLPPEHPLWRTPNCYITPHTGGGHANEKDELVDHFLQNLRRFEAGEALVDRII